MVIPLSIVLALAAIQVAAKSPPNVSPLHSLDVFQSGAVARSWKTELIPRALSREGSRSRSPNSRGSNASGRSRSPSSSLENAGSLGRSSSGGHSLRNSDSPCRPRRQPFTGNRGSGMLSHGSSALLLGEGSRSDSLARSSSSGFRFSTDNPVGTRKRRRQNSIDKPSLDPVHSQAGTPRVQTQYGTGGIQTPFSDHEPPAWNNPALAHLRTGPLRRLSGLSQRPSGARTSLELGEAERGMRASPMGQRPASSPHSQRPAASPRVSHPTTSHWNNMRTAFRNAKDSLGKAGSAVTKAVLQDGTTRDRAVTLGNAGVMAGIAMLNKEQLALPPVDPVKCAGAYILLCGVAAASAPTAIDAFTGRKDKAKKQRDEREGYSPGGSIQRRSLGYLNLDRTIYPRDAVGLFAKWSGNNHGMHGYPLVQRSLLYTNFDV